METTWILKTHGDPLGSVRKFLAELWARANLDGFVIPRFQPLKPGIFPYLASKREELVHADPFTPLVADNSAREIARVARQDPKGHFAVILRPCEGRALLAKQQREDLSLENWLLIAVDCLASFPREDFAWRIEKAGGIEQLTREALQFARLGGIAPYRFRRACQMCTNPRFADASISIKLLGLPVRDYILIAAASPETAQRLGLADMADGLASRAMITHHQRVLDRLERKRFAVRKRMVDNLAPEMPTSLDDLLAFFEKCAPCQLCLQACPVYSGELDRREDNDHARLHAIKRWLAACVACGMCDEACPRHTPLTAIIQSLESYLVTNMYPA